MLALALAAVAAQTRRPAGFATGDHPGSWPAPRWRPRPELLERSLETLPGVGPSLRRRLAKLGLATVGDLLAHRPRRYEEPVAARRIADPFGEEEVALEGRVVRASSRRAGRRLTVQSVRVRDASGEVDAVWFNQPWLVERLTPGTELRLRGALRRGRFAVRSYDVGAASATADFAPVYPASEDVAPTKLRQLVEAAVPLARALPDALPASLRQRESLPLRADAVAALHRPRTLAEAELARRRLAFDELLTLQLGLARAARGREQATAPALAPPGELARRYRGVLPFRLTPDQERTMRELDAELTQAAPMQRLLQGDVGSGKTVVALYALLRAVENGLRGAMMAPTETLAEQHFLTLEGVCRELGVGVGLLTSSVPARERRRAAEAEILVGTHALIQEGVELDRLGVAVVDEQHRFGVEQRRALTEGRSPHLLHMTATPIPRTLALTVYGDLRVSELSRPPADRKPVVTRWVPEERAAEAYRRLTRLLREGRQAYVVCPLVEDSEGKRARAAEQEAERLRAAELRGFRVGCVHGRLKPAERRELMARFKARELDVLVATTVIEVGVDVPNATVMIVQEADRFGLAQLHQLRGRVGRGGEQSYCLLVSRAKEELTESARARLEALVATSDGFELAELDLELRGEGQLLGTRQSGLSDLRFTRLRADRDVLERAREAAASLVDHEGPLADEVDRRFADADVAA
ncbi:MAG: ATP-dependent DNA helicase RecG [Thermoleophilia bacterium]|nr:ATP-dependent DNA helicase RecG [Thermoleophilia bacterium]